MCFVVILIMQYASERETVKFARQKHMKSITISVWLLQGLQKSLRKSYSIAMR